MAITLRFLATGDSYKSLSYAFRVAHNTISYSVPATCRAIVAVYGDEELQVPQTPEAWKQVARGLLEVWVTLKLKKPPSVISWWCPWA